MNRRNKPVSLHILDKDYVFSCPEHERDELLASAEYLTRKMREVKDGGKVAGTERIAVMAALHIVHELLQYKHQNMSYNNIEIEGKLGRLQRKIAQALEKSKTPL